MICTPLAVRKNQQGMTLREIIQLFIPPFYYKLKKRLFPQKERPHYALPKVEHANQRMIVIGNGPSLKKTIELYEQQLHESDCVMVNFSARTPLYEQIQPSFYVLTDAYWEQDNENVHACVNAIVTKTVWPMTLVLPSQLRSWWALDEFSKNKNITILFDGGSWYPLADEQLFPAFDENRICPPTYTVLTYCIYMSIYWGYEETYLVGADTSFIKDMYVGQKDNVLYTVDTHFYNNADVCSRETEPEFKGVPFGCTMEEKLYELYMVFHEYNMLNRYALWKGVKVYNASEYSMIDCYERRKLV